MAVIGYKQFAQTFLKSMAIKKVPVSAAIKLLKLEGISFRRTEMLRTYRSYAKIPKLTDAFKYIPKKYRIPENLFIKEMPYQTKNYLYEGVFKLKDIETGREFIKPARYSSDFHLTQSLVEQECLSASEEGFKGYNWEVVGFEVTAAFKLKDMY